MSLGSWNMVGGALGAAFSLLLLASIIQGLRDVEVFHSEKIEAVVGQNVTLPCTVKSSADLKIGNIEWSKNREENENTKLAVYNPNFGLHRFWYNVTIQIENMSMGSYLHLYGVSKWDSGVYNCEISTFPHGSIRRETELEIKDDVQIMCDVNSTVEAHAGENVTIQCRAFPDAQYKWTKNKTLVSENESLELRCVTDAHTGVYTLTVNTGNKSLHKEFIITVLTATTSLKTDPVTVPPQSNITEEIVSADNSLTTSSPTTGLSTTSTNGTWTMSTGTDATDDYTKPSNVTAGEQITLLTNSTHVDVTLSPSTHTNPTNSTDQEINPTHYHNTSTFSDQSVPNNLSTTLTYGNEVFRSTQETTTESTRGNPNTPGTTTTTMVIEDEVDGGRLPPVLKPCSNTNEAVIYPGTAGVRSHLLLALIIVPIVVLIAVAGFLYRRWIKKQRMDLPPPFKPPPPPVKYTAVRHQIYTQQFPTSRCDSVTEFKDMKEMFISI